MNRAIQCKMNYEQLIMNNVVATLAVAHLKALSVLTDFNAFFRKPLIIIFSVFVPYWLRIGFDSPSTLFRVFYFFN
jgi:hypothetical protein